MVNYRKYVVSEDKLSRLELVGPAEVREQVIDSLIQDGYSKLTYAGAYTDSELFPQTDPSRFRLIAERHESDIEDSGNVQLVLPRALLCEFCEELDRHLGESTDFPTIFGEFLSFVGDFREEEGE